MNPTKKMRHHLLVVVAVVVDFFEQQLQQLSFQQIDELVGELVLID